MPLNDIEKLDQQEADFGASVLPSAATDSDWVGTPKIEPMQAPSSTTSSDDIVTARGPSCLSSMPDTIKQETEIPLCLSMLPKTDTKPLVHKLSSVYEPDEQGLSRMSPVLSDPEPLKSAVPNPFGDQILVPSEALSNVIMEPDNVSEHWGVPNPLASIEPSSKRQKIADTDKKMS